MLFFFVDLINIENLRISFRFFYSLSFLILLFFVAELRQFTKMNLKYQGLVKKKMQQYHF